MDRLWRVDSRRRRLLGGKVNWVQPFKHFMLEGFLLFWGKILKTKGIIVAGTHSGAGKTTITLGLMAALRRRGISVAPFKVGPDFIDPGHHSRITGETSRNLDGWMLPEKWNRQCFSKHAPKAGVAVVEGVMGLFDGYRGDGEAGSTAQMAKWLGLPVLLVVDAKSMARSAAAVVEGFQRFDPNLTFAGVVFNRVGSARHLDYLEEAMGSRDLMPVLGGIPVDGEVAIPERHLGLYTDDDHALDEKRQQQLARLIENNIDLDRLLDGLPDLRPGATAASASAACVSRESVPVAVARDSAFCFYYQDNLELIEAFGGRPVFFSPLEAGRLPDSIGGIYLGGGYPELYAQQLSENRSLMADIRGKSAAGMPIYGECGGFMYLCRSLQDGAGKVHAMAGCFPFTVKMSDHLQALGYRQVTTVADCLLGPRGMQVRGHEFHYSRICAMENSIETVYGISDRRGAKRMQEGFQIDRTLGGYVHLHFGSCPEAAMNFVETCRRHAASRCRGIP